MSNPDCEDEGLPETVTLHDCPAPELLAFLRKAPKPPFDSGHRKAMLNYALDCARWHAGLENTIARVSLALAERVKERK